MRPHSIFFLLGITTLFAACAVPTLNPSAPIPTTIPAAPTRAANSIPVIQINTANIVETQPGERATIHLRLQPIYLQVGKTASGAAFTSYTPWENANVAQMRVCVQIEKPCAPTGAWVDFQSEWTVDFDTNWLGERVVWLGAQFRDANGNLIAVPAESDPTRAQELGAARVILRSSVDSRTPLASQPEFAQTAVAKTRVAFPVIGSLVLQDGLCCAGGKVGTTIEIRAAFEAASPNTTVTHMRLLNHCGTLDEMNGARWEPFVKQKTFSYQIIGMNWVGWSLATQYRDANGHLSPVYCDDISVEGMW